MQEQVALGDDADDGSINLALVRDALQAIAE